MFRSSTATCKNKRKMQSSKCKDKKEFFHFALCTLHFALITSRLEKNVKLTLMLKIENYIGGELAPPVSGEYLDNINPATGDVYSLIPDSDERDVKRAAEAARAAFPVWSKMSAEARHDALMRVSQLIERDLERLAEAESTDNGKPLALARQVDIPRAVSNFKFYATAALHFASEAHETAGQAINYTLRQPLGVVGCISPWNLPLSIASITAKVGPEGEVANTCRISVA